MKRLKDKVWTRCKIKIEAIVEQHKEGIQTTNKTVGWIVTVSDCMVSTSQRVNTKTELWKFLKEEVYL